MREIDGASQGPDNPRFSTIKYQPVYFDHSDLQNLARNILERPEVYLVSLKLKHSEPTVISHEKLEEIRKAPKEKQEEFVVQTAFDLRGAKRAIVTIREPEPMEKPKAELPPVYSSTIDFINNDLIDIPGFIEEELPQLDFIGKPNEKTAQKPTVQYATRQATIMYPSKEEAQSIVEASANNPNKAMLLFWGEKEDKVAAKPVKPYDVSNTKGRNGLGMLIGEILNADGVVLVEMKKNPDTSTS